MVLQIHHVVIECNVWCAAQEAAVAKKYLLEATEAINSEELDGTSLGQKSVSLEDIIG